MRGQARGAALSAIRDPGGGGIGKPKRPAFGYAKFAILEEEEASAAIHADLMS